MPEFFFSFSKISEELKKKNYFLNIKTKKLF